MWRIAVKFGELNGKTFTQITRTDTEWIAGLNDTQHRLNFVVFYMIIPLVKTCHGSKTLQQFINIKLHKAHIVHGIHQIIGNQDINVR